ncbi:MAG: circadian clock protein KaiC [Thermodesulfobacterium sp.]|nr:circadian clock protein KaiC [Thermodesulfobacterium sp.]
MEKLRTGIFGFDELTHGGLPKYSTIILAGSPGSGKTTLAFETAFNLARDGKRTLIISTVSEPLAKMVRFMSSFSFFDKKFIGREIFFEDISEFIQKEDPAVILEHIDFLIKKIRPELLIIDSFKSLCENLFDSEKIKRKFLYTLSLRLSIWQVTSFFVGEYLLSDIKKEIEFSVADGIIYLFGTEEAELQKRYIQILKLRGSSFEKGKQYFDITSDGIKIYLRLRPDIERIRYCFSEKEIKTGIAEIDRMFGGGIRKGSVTLISGPTGIGKTIFTLKFAESYLKADKNHKFLFFSFEESPDWLIKYAQALNFELEPFIKNNKLKFIFLSPVELDLDYLCFRIMYEIRNTGEDTGIAIDSITSFRYSQRDDIRYREMLWSLMNFFKYSNNTAFITYEVEDPFGVNLIAHEMKISVLSDSIITLRYYEDSPYIKRALSVIKIRGSNHSKEIREFDIVEGKGIIIKELVSKGIMK